MKFKAFKNFGNLFSSLYPGWDKGELSTHQKPWSQFHICKWSLYPEVVNREESGLEDTPEGLDGSKKLIVENPYIGLRPSLPCGT